MTSKLTVGSKVNICSVFASEFHDLPAEVKRLTKTQVIVLPDGYQTERKFSRKTGRGCGQHNEDWLRSTDLKAYYGI